MPPKGKRKKGNLICEVCRSDRFSEDELGFWVCDMCFTRSQNLISEENEYDAKAFSTFGGRFFAVATLKASKHSEQVDALQESLDRTRVLLTAFQHALKVQCTTLIQKFHCNPALFGVVGRLWLNYLQWWRSEGWGVDEYRMNVTKLGTGSMRFRDERGLGRGRSKANTAAAVAAVAASSSAKKSPLNGDDDGDVEQTETDDESHANPLLDPTEHEPVDMNAAAERDSSNVAYKKQLLYNNDNDDMDGNDTIALVLANAGNRSQQQPLSSRPHYYGHGHGDDDDSQRTQTQMDPRLPVASLPSSSSASNGNSNGAMIANDPSSSPLASAVDLPRYIPPKSARVKSGLWSEHVTVHRPGDLAISLSLVLCQLGCQYIQEPISMHDITTWVKSGQLPFHNLLTQLPDDVTKELTKFPSFRRFFSPRICPQSGWLSVFAARTAYRLKLHLAEPPRVSLSYENLNRPGVFVRASNELRRKPRRRKSTNNRFGSGGNGDNTATDTDGTATDGESKQQRHHNNTNNPSFTKTKRSVSDEAASLARDIFHRVAHAGDVSAADQSDGSEGARWKNIARSILATNGGSDTDGHSQPRASIGMSLGEDDMSQMPQLPLAVSGIPRTSHPQASEVNNDDDGSAAAAAAAAAGDTPPDISMEVHANVALLARRYVLELGLPEQLVPCIWRLIALYPSSMPTLEPTSAMVFVVIAVQLCYPLTMDVNAPTPTYEPLPPSSSTDDTAATASGATTGASSTGSMAPPAARSSSQKGKKAAPAKKRGADPAVQARIQASSHTTAEQTLGSNAWSRAGVLPHEFLNSLPPLRYWFIAQFRQSQIDAQMQPGADFHKMVTPDDQRAYLDYCERHFSGGHQVPEFLTGDAARLRQLAKGFACTPRAHERERDTTYDNDDHDTDRYGDGEHKSESSSSSSSSAASSSSSSKGKSTIPVGIDNVGRAPPTTVLPCQNFLMYPSQGRDHTSSAPSRYYDHLPHEQRAQVDSQFGHGHDDAHFHTSFFLLLKYCARHVGIPLLRLHMWVDSTVRCLRRQLGRHGYTRSLHLARMQRYLLQKRLLAQVRRARELKRRQMQQAMLISRREQKLAAKQRYAVKAIGDVIGRHAAIAIASLPLPPPDGSAAAIALMNDDNGDGDGDAHGKESKVASTSLSANGKKTKKSSKQPKKKKARLASKKTKKKAHGSSDTSSDIHDSSNNDARHHDSDSDYVPDTKKTKSKTKKSSSVHFAVPHAPSPAATSTAAGSAAAMRTDEDTETDPSPTPNASPMSTPNGNNGNGSDTSIIPSPLTLLSSPSPSLVPSPLTRPLESSSHVPSSSSSLLAPSVPSSSTPRKRRRRDRANSSDSN